MNRSSVAFFAFGTAATLGIALLGGCGNGGASEPLQTSVDPAANSKLQFGVGVATLASANGSKVSYGLNEVETLRQSNGLSGTLYNVPMIIGPTTFDVLNSTRPGQRCQSAGNDLGTNHITWGTLNQSQWTGPVRGLKQASSGAFGYGLCPCNSDSGPINGTSPLYQAYNLPIYGNDEELWYGGPPAFPQAGPSLITLGWFGYSLGFTTFAIQPVIGTYHLYAAVPPSFDTPQNPTPSPNPSRHTDAAARHSRSGRTAGVAQSTAVLRNAGIHTGRQGRGKDLADGSERCERSAGRGVCAARRQRHLRSVALVGLLLHFSHTHVRRADADAGRYTRAADAVGSEDTDDLPWSELRRLRSRDRLPGLRIFLSAEPFGAAVDQGAQRPSRRQHLRQTLAAQYP